MLFPLRRFLCRPLCVAAMAVLSGGVQAQETFKIGIVSFLSGQAAESFGIPAVNGAKVLVDAFNKGQAPAPYNKVGIGGLPIEAIYVDEAGGTAAHESMHSVNALVIKIFSNPITNSHIFLSFNSHNNSVGRKSVHFLSHLINNFNHSDVTGL